jgi:hypothetical protein
MLVDARYLYRFLTCTQEDIKLNVQILVRSVGAIEHLSKNLKFLVLPTGTMYGTPTSRDCQTVETAHLVPLRPTAYF